MLPIQAVWTDFKHASGRNLGWGDPVWWGERLSGDLPQTVLSFYGTKRGDEANRFSRFIVQVACYHTNRQTAETRAQAVLDAYKAFASSATNNAGITFAGSTGWMAEQARPELRGVVDALQIENGTLYMAVCAVLFVNLHQT